MRIQSLEFPITTSSFWKPLTPRHPLLALFLLLLTQADNLPELEKQRMCFRIMLKRHMCVHTISRPHMYANMCVCAYVYRCNIHIHGYWICGIICVYTDIYIYMYIFNGLRPGSAAPTHLRISARDERKHAICRQTQTDTKTRRQTRSGGGGSSRTRRQTQMRRQTQTEPDRHKDTRGGGDTKKDADT